MAAMTTSTSIVKMVQLEITTLTIGLFMICMIFHSLTEKDEMAHDILYLYDMGVVDRDALIT